MKWKKKPYWTFVCSSQIVQCVDFSIEYSNCSTKSELSSWAFSSLLKRWMSFYSFFSPIFLFALVTRRSNFYSKLMVVVMASANCLPSLITIPSMGLKCVFHTNTSVNSQKRKKGNAFGLSVMIGICYKSEQLSFLFDSAALITDTTFSICNSSKDNWTKMSTLHIFFPFIYHSISFRSMSGDVMVCDHLKI